MGLDASPGPDGAANWVERYLDLLGIEARAPGLAALADLTRAHVRAVPFENATAILRRRDHPGGPVPPLDPAAMLDAWRAGRGGAICFEVADLFARLLTALGYRAHPILANITFPGSHQAILVELPAGRYLVDAGNGAPFFAPIPLDGAVEVRAAGLAFRFRPGDLADEWLQERWVDGGWRLFCRYDLRPPDPAEREAAYQRHHTPGQSWVVAAPRLIRCEPDAVYQLHAGEFSRYTPEGKRTEPATDAATVARLTADVFRLPGLPIEAASQAIEGWR